ncbi:MAG: LysR family transcriptional regulator [Deltaproteobacteria bacterium]|nr:LysR family transcriptional regulator [Deltaproteobacteria bacterium]
MKVRVKISLNDDDGSFMGIGLVWLLRGVEQFGSVRKSAMQMKMSYPKAVKIIDRLEKALGYSLVIRTRGGIRGGNSFVTPEGIAFIEKFEHLHQQITSFSNEKFNEIFVESNPH